MVKLIFILFVEVRYKGVINHHKLWVPKCVCGGERLLLTEGDNFPASGIASAGCRASALFQMGGAASAMGHCKVLAKWACELKQ